MSARYYSVGFASIKTAVSLTINKNIFYQDGKEAVCLAASDFRDLGRAVKRSASLIAKMAQPIDALIF